MFSAPKPAKAPDPVPIEKLVAKTAQGVKSPSKLRPLRSKRKNKFNLQRDVSTVGGVNKSGVGAALGIKR